MATTFTAEVKGYEKVVAEYNKVQKEVTKLREEIKRLNDATGQTGETHKKSSEAGKKHFDIMAAGRKEITSLVAGYLTMQGAIQLVGNAMRYVQEETNKAVASLKGMQPVQAQLQQVSKGTDDLAEMTAETDRLSAKYGEKREGVAKAIVQSRNFEFAMTDVEQMSKYGDIMDVGTQAEMGGKVSQLFGGKISAMEAVSMAGRAAEPSAAEFPDFSQGLATAAEGGKAAGASPEATYAMFSALTSQFRSWETASNRVKAMGSKIGIAKESGKADWLKGLDMPEAVMEIQRRGAKLDIFKDDSESRAAFDASLQQMPMIEKVRKGGREELATMRSGGESWMEGKYRNRFDPTLATTKTEAGKQYVVTQLALEENRKAEQVQIQQEEKSLAMRGLSNETQRAQTKTKLLQQGASGLSRAAASGAMSAAELAGSSDVGFWGRVVGGGPMQGRKMSDVKPDDKTIGDLIDVFRNIPRSGSTAMNAATLAGQQQR